MGTYLSLLRKLIRARVNKLCDVTGIDYLESNLTLSSLADIDRCINHSFSTFKDISLVNKTFRNKFQPNFNRINRRISR